jgi:beta-lactam-binding protein with PASTA domain
VAFNPVALIKDVPVPNVVDLRRADAIDMLTEAGLVPEIMNIGEIVETQEPVAQTLKVGSRIKIKLRGSER